VNTTFHRMRDFVRKTCGLDVIRWCEEVKHVRAPQFRVDVLHTSYLDLLSDHSFIETLEYVGDTTLLDLPRLANLWNLARMTNPQGGVLEVGCYRGGSARLLASACPNRPVYVCDTFEGFTDALIDPVKDPLFHRHQFDATSFEAVASLFASDRERVHLIQGLFPASDRLDQVRNLSFAHLDVDLFKSMQDCLNYLEDRFLQRSLIVADDYQRSAPGVDQALAEFTARNSHWVAFPLFPGQALLVHDSCFGSG
jgi:O-methyltransferase